MDNRIIVSVPHTGTRFLAERLGIKDRVHTVFPWENILKKVEGKKIIAPLRRPRDAWKSKIRRMNPELLAENTVGWFNSWYMLHALSLVKEIDFIPVDLKQDPRITDWTPVTGEGHLNNTEFLDVGINLRKLYDLPFVKRFYN